MNAQQLATILRNDIKKLKDEKGINTIDSEKLILLLENLSKDENLKQNIEKDADVNRQAFIKSIEHKQEWNVELFRAAISKGESALKTAFLMNGGATIALLAFLGQLSTHAPNKISTFADSLVSFVGGVFFIVISYAAAYFSQCCYAEENKKSKGDMYRRITIILAISSYLFFIEGSIIAYLGFKNF